MKYRCPKCKDSKIDVVSRVWRSLIQSDDGEFECIESRHDNGDDWNESSGMVCRNSDCGYVGCVQDFEVSLTYKRELELTCMAVSYLIANLDDACDVFVADEEGSNDDGKLSVRGLLMDSPTDNELSILLERSP